MFLYLHAFLSYHIDVIISTTMIRKNGLLQALKIAAWIISHHELNEKGIVTLVSMKDTAIVANRRLMF